jgi:hypothetical protein
MGGYGSGWRGPKKTTVEDCLVLSAAIFIRKKLLLPGRHAAGAWSWTQAGQSRPHAEIGYESNLIDPVDAWVRLHYSVNGEAVDYRVRMETTRPNYGGLRWWFLCPLQRPDGGAPRRVDKLLLPPGGRYFGSRQSYDLTYTSCQESGKFRGLFTGIARDMGMDAATIRRALKMTEFG